MLETVSTDPVEEKGVQKVHYCIISIILSVIMCLLLLVIIAINCDYYTQKTSILNKIFSTLYEKHALRTKC